MTEPTPPQHETALDELRSAAATSTLPHLPPEQCAALAEHIDRLRGELAALREVSRGYCPECGRSDAAPTVEDWQREHDRADKAERERDRLWLLLEIARGELGSVRLLAEQIRRLVEYPVTVTALPVEIAQPLRYYATQLVRALTTGPRPGAAQRRAGGPAAAETGTQPQQDGSEAQEAAQPQYLPGHPGKLAQRPDWLDKPERQRTAEEIRIYRLDHCGTCRDAEFYGWFGTVAEQAHAAHLEAVDVGPLAGTPCRCPKHAEAATGYRAVRRQQHPEGGQR